jgi:ATP-dependent helicase/DNAse subunit B
LIVTYFRSSSYNTHDDCPHRYFLEYVLGWYGKSNKAADKGTIVHKVLEILACAKLAEQQGKDFIIDDEVLKERKLVALQDIPKLVDEIYDWYSYHNSHNPWEGKDRKDCHDWVNKVFNHNAGMFDPRSRDIVEPEQQFDITLDFDWANYSYEFDGKKIEGKLALKGTIDLITRIDDNLYEVIDWKTGRRWDWAKGVEKTNDKLAKDPQLMLYHYAVKKLYPDVEDCLITIYFINDGGPFTLAFTKNDIVQTENMLRKKFEQIKATHIPRLNKTWKCTKLCHHGKTTFAGTSIQPIIDEQDGCLTKCEQVKRELGKKGMDRVTKEYLAPGHVIGSYKAPGSVDNVITESKNNGTDQTP